VNLKAATLILPKLLTLKSLVIVPMQAKIGSFLLRIKENIRVNQGLVSSRLELFL
jgi:hypothetical protein